MSVSWKSGYVLIRGIDTGGSVIVHRSDGGGNTIVTNGRCWCLILGMMPDLMVQRLGSLGWEVNCFTLFGNETVKLCELSIIWAPTVQPSCETALDRCLTMYMHCLGARCLCTHSLLWHLHAGIVRKCCALNRATWKTQCSRVFIGHTY